MGRRLVIGFAFILGAVGFGVLGATPASAAASIGKTGIYEDSCGNQHVWVNGTDLTPIDNIWCGPADS